ncbi:hypothetical protein CLIM01_06383 [Colletotrichum limetticola]|uniref:Uncharacterized protein n=1 Tax=Colletotrichum limetticola TaxID=1209924 RepID=A0ABQ9PXI7_9PEZI|nr:hypothetical protein CLIM01_06383 [Colletotrichum limetticola]
MGCGHSRTGFQVGTSISHQHAALHHQHPAGQTRPLKGPWHPRWLLSAIIWERPTSIVASVHKGTASLTIATRAEHAIAFDHDMDVNQMYGRLCGSLAAKGPRSATPGEDGD